MRMSQEQYDRLQNRSRPRSKYGNVRTDGFDSKRERNLYTSLRASLKGGALRALGRQVEFRLPGGVIYKADFVAIHNDGRIEVMDAKGVRTAVYKVKAKQMAELGYPVTEL